MQKQGAEETRCVERQSAFFLSSGMGKSRPASVRTTVLLHGSSSAPEEANLEKHGFSRH